MGFVGGGSSGRSGSVAPRKVATMDGGIECQRTRSAPLQRIVERINEKHEEAKRISLPGNMHVQADIQDYLKDVYAALVVSGLRLPFETLGLLNQFPQTFLLREKNWEHSGQEGFS